MSFSFGDGRLEIVVKRGSNVDNTPERNAKNSIWSHVTPVTVGLAPDDFVPFTAYLSSLTSTGLRGYEIYADKTRTHTVVAKPVCNRNTLVMDDRDEPCSRGCHVHGTVGLNVSIKLAPTRPSYTCEGNDRVLLRTRHTILLHRSRVLRQRTKLPLPSLHRHLVLNFLALYTPGGYGHKWFFYAVFGNCRSTDFLESRKNWELMNHENWSEKLKIDIHILLRICISFSRTPEPPNFKNGVKKCSEFVAKCECPFWVFRTNFRDLLIFNFFRISEKS